MGYCRTCQKETVALSTGLCSTCAERRYPPIVAQRGESWSPLKVALLSIVCDPLFIPTFMALSRAFSELHVVARREREGYWSDEHAEVRTGAMWGIAIASMRPLLFVAVAIAVTFRSMTAPVAPYRPPAPDEIDEVLHELRRPAGRALAIEHLGQIPLSSRDASRVAQAVREGFGQSPRVEHEISSRAVEALARAPAASEEELPSFYPGVDRDARTAILDRLAQSEERLGVLASLIATEAQPDAAQIPIERLRTQGASRAIFLPALITHPYAPISDIGIELAADLCAGGNAIVDGTELAATYEALMTAWSARRDAMMALPPAASIGERLSEERATRAREAELAVRALECIPRSDDALMEALAIDDARVAGAAVQPLLLRGHRLPQTVVARIAADPLARSALVRALDPRALERIPERYRSARAVAESDLLLDARAPDLVSVAWLAEEHGVHVFRILYSDRALGHAAIGRYGAEWDEHPRVAYSDPSAVWTDASAIELASQLEVPYR